MSKKLDPKEFGLPARTILVQVNARTIALVIERKSRIIMVDGKKILAKADIIRQQRPGITVLLKTSAPVCSKTIRFLADEGIEISTIA